MNKQIKINELSWQPDKKNPPIVDSVSSVFEPGCFYGILGPNGAGKTSLVRQILRLAKKTEGEIYIEDKNLDDMSRNNIASVLSFLPQNINKDIDFSVYDVVAMGRENKRKMFSALSVEDIKIIEESMKYANCFDFQQKSISHLSGGELQRVMIARTIAQDTPWIILDEPVSNLDVRHQYELMKVLEKLREEKGKTVIAILHDLNLAARFCDRIVLMKDGKIFINDAKDKVLTKENLKSVYDMEFEFINANNTTVITPKFI